MCFLRALFVFFVALNVVACSPLKATKAGAVEPPQASWAGGPGDAHQLRGQIVDAQTKNPVVDAVVTITSPALQGEQTVVTDGEGVYRFSVLPSGVYNLVVQADRYRQYSRGGVAVSSESPPRLDVELLSETLQSEEVTVVGKPEAPSVDWVSGRPTVDVGSTTSGLNISADSRGPELQPPPPPPYPPQSYPPAPPQPPASPPPGAAGAKADGDAAPKPIAGGMKLTYEATLTLAVADVGATLSAVEALAKESGGYLVSRSNTQAVVRVPQARFEEGLRKVEPLGEVLNRAVNVQDVTDEFHDVELRLKNARTLRDRLQALLARANVADAINIERELGRITESIELLEGRLKGLSGRIAFARVEVNCQARARQAAAAPRRRWPADWAWVQKLGLGPLLLNNEGN